MSRKDSKGLELLQQVHQKLPHRSKEVAMGSMKGIDFARIFFFCASCCSKSRSIKAYFSFLSSDNFRFISRTMRPAMVLM